MPQAQTVSLGMKALQFVQAISNRSAQEAMKQLEWGNPIRAEVTLGLDQDVIVARFVTYIAEQQCARHTFKAPADWREAIKERWAPAWALKRWPVRYRIEVVEVSECYPKIALPPSHGPSFRIMLAQTDPAEYGDDWGAN